MNKRQDPQAPSSRDWGRLKPVTWLAGLLLVGAMGAWHLHHNYSSITQPTQNQVAGGESSERRALRPPAAVVGLTDRFSDEPSQEQRAAISEHLQQLLSESAPQGVRRRAAWLLGKDTSLLAYEGLKDALAKDVPGAKELVAEALGQSTRAESQTLLQSLLGDTSDAVVMAAIRGLAQQGTPTAVTAINQVLLDTSRDIDIRAEAASGLGAITRPEALDALTVAIGMVQESSVLTEVVRSLGSRDIEETRGVLQPLLDSPQTPAELKIDTLEGLAQAKGDATALLLSYANDKDSDIRRAALWSMATLEVPGSAGSELMALLGEETSPAVRKRLYQALANQQEFDLQRAWDHITSEKESVARLAGLDLLARVVQRSPTPEMVAFFDQQAVPELRNVAMNGTVRDERMGALLALRRARTASAFTALRDIAGNGADPAVAEATGSGVPLSGQRP